MKTKKKLAVVLTLTVAFTLLPVSTLQFRADASQAYQKVTSTSGTVTAQDVNLRTGPATKYDILCKLKKGQKLTVMGKLGDWYAVYDSSNGNVGAVSSDYFKIVQARPTTNTKQAGKTQGKSVAAAAKVIELSKDEKTVLDLVNKTRKEEGLSLLVPDEGLEKIARLKAEDLKENNYFSHTSSYFGTPFDMMKKYGIKFSIAGENLAGNQSIEKAVRSWLDESENNLHNSEFTRTGIGVVDSPTYGKLFVQMFTKE